LPTEDLTQPTFSEAVELFRYQGTFSAYATDPATRWCIWIKWQSVDGVQSTDPAGGTNGVVATTGQDVALLLDALTGEITSTELHATLGTRIDLIDAASSVAGSVNARLSAETVARTNALAEEATTRAAALLAEAASRASSDSDLQTQINTITAATGGDLEAVIAAVQQEQTARASADGAEAASRETLAVQMRGAYTGTDINAVTTGLMYSERVARVSAMDAEVMNRNAAIVSNIESSEGTLTALNDALLAGLGVIDSASAVRTQAEQDARIAAVISETNARISADDAEASARLALVAVVNANAAILTQEQNTRAAADSTMAAQINTMSAAFDDNTAAIQAEAIARADADTAEANARTTLQATVDGHTSSIQTEATTRATQTGELYAQYTVKLDVNGKVSGYGLASSGPTGPGSTFEIRADKFVLAAPTGSAAGYVPFTVLATSQVIGGVTFPAGVYAQRAFLVDLQVTNAKIGSLAVDDGKVANLSAAKLTIGDGTVGGNLKSSNYAAGSAGWIIKPNGYAEMNNIVVRGTVYASAGSFTGTVSASTINGGTVNGTTVNSSTINGSTINSVTLNSGAINITGDGGSGWGYVRSANKWWNDGVNGWVFSKIATDGSTLMEIKSGSSRIWSSSWDDCGIIFPGISMTNGGLTISQANVIGTLNIAGNAATICQGGESTGGTATVSFTLSYAADIQLIGTAAHPTALSIQFYLDGAPYGGSELVQGTAVIAKKVSLAAGYHTFQTVSGGVRASIIVFASIR
jgi:hypothetical protein